MQMYQNYRYFCMNIGQKVLKSKRCILPVLLLLTVCPVLRAQDLEHIWRDRIMNFRPLYGQPDTLSMVFIGDVMMHAKQLEYNFRTFLEPVRSRLEAADVAVANMEFTLAGEPYSGYPAFSAPDGYAEYLADCGVDVFLMANNHILDKGKKGLSRTLDRYRSMERIRFTGAAKDSVEDRATWPLIVTAKGLRIALVNFTYGTNTGDPSGWPKVHVTDLSEIDAALQRARRLGADFIVALPHWGVEYRLRHDKTDEKTAAWLAEQGVDAVIGAHPHVVQDTARIGRMPVVYSMGNAVSNMSAINTRLELMVTLRFTKDRWRNVAMLPPQLEFLWCTLPGTLTDSYATIAVKDWLGKRDLWKDPSDYDNMTATYRRVKAETGIED